MVIDITRRHVPSRMTFLVLSDDDFTRSPYAVAVDLMDAHANATAKLLNNEHRYWLHQLDIAKADFCFRVLECVHRISLPHSRRRLPR